MTLDLPAPAGGALIDLSVTSLSDPAPVTVPAQVTVAAGDQSISFDVTAGAASGEATVVADLGGTSTASSAVSVSDGLVGDGLIFSQYVEGAGNDKLIEIQNLSGDAVDLSTCVVNKYVNGSTSPTEVELDTTTVSSLAPGEVYVACNTQIDVPAPPLVPANCQASSGSWNFNGDDALELVCGGVVQDILGTIGEDPGSEWGTPPVATANTNLIRNCGTLVGDRDGSDPFDPANGWTAAAVLDDYSDVGEPIELCAP